MKSANTLGLALAAFRKHKALYGSYDKYPGIVSMHGLARLASETGDEALIEEARSALLPYVHGERSFHANFPNYLCGGNATAWLCYRGHLPEAAGPVRKYAEQIMHDAPRDADGILCSPARPGEAVIWVDIAFAISPFLLFTGLFLRNDDYLEEAFQQTAKIVRVFRSEETGLLFQSRNFLRPGHMTEDHWGRGNGWVALALGELAVHLPDGHPRKREAVSLYLEHMRACAAFQNEEGLWCQEMTAIGSSYVETSGSALILYALGIGLQAGIVSQSELEHFKKGLRGFLTYVSENTDIFHTCCGCLSPGEGTKLDYMARPPKVNDLHAFGPVVLAMGQAHLIGIREVTALPVQWALD